MLAPALSCVAIDWIFGHMSSNHGVALGPHTISDLVYADDTILFYAPGGHGSERRRSIGADLQDRHLPFLIDLSSLSTARLT